MLFIFLKNVYMIERQNIEATTHGIAQQAKRFNKQNFLTPHL